MEVEFSEKFYKELQKIDHPKIYRSVKNLIEEVKNAGKLTEVNKVKKLKGYQYIYRARIGEYRVGLILKEEIVSFETILPRKDIYKKFP